MFDIILVHLSLLDIELAQINQFTTIRRWGVIYWHFCVTRMILAERSQHQIPIIFTASRPGPESRLVRASMKSQLWTGSIDSTPEPSCGQAGQKQRPQAAPPSITLPSRVTSLEPAGVPWLVDAGASCNIERRVSQSRSECSWERIRPRHQLCVCCYFLWLIQDIISWHPAPAPGLVILWPLRPGTRWNKGGWPEVTSDWP